MLSTSKKSIYFNVLKIHLINELEYFFRKTEMYLYY